MLTTGIIKEINISDGNYKNNKYLVEVSLFKSPSDTNSNNYTYEANCCVPGGLLNTLNVGDKVYIDFLNNKYSQPIIMGKIYQGLIDDSRSYALLNSLKVTGTTELSENTTIGSYNVYDSLRKSDVILTPGTYDRYLYANHNTNQIEWINQGYLHVIKLTNAKTGYECDITYTLLTDSRDIGDVNSNAFIVNLNNKKYNLVSISGYYQISTVIGVSYKGYAQLNLINNLGVITETNYLALLTAGAIATDTVYLL